MDWDKLRIFHMVAKAGSFTHAGATLNLSQSAVSNIFLLLKKIWIWSFFTATHAAWFSQNKENYSTKPRPEIFGRMVMIEGQLSDARDSGEGIWH